MVVERQGKCANNSYHTFRAASQYCGTRTGTRLEASIYQWPGDLTCSRVPDQHPHSVPSRDKIDSQTAEGEQGRTEQVAYEVRSAITHVLWDTSTPTLRRCPASGRHNRNAYNFAKRRNQTGSGAVSFATDASCNGRLKILTIFSINARFHQLFSKLGNFTRGDNRRSRLPQLRAQVGFFIDLNRRPVNGLRFLPNSVRPYRGQPRLERPVVLRLLSGR